MTNKGFTLAEMVAVIAILMVLALISTPFVKGYIDDSYYGKAQIFLRQLNEARMNFEKDYPGFIISGTLQDLGDDNNTCDIFALYQESNSQVLAPNNLVRCHYVKFPAELSGRYTFSVRNFTSNCDEGSGLVVAMEGADRSSKYYQKCVTMDNLGQVNGNELGN